MDELNERLIRAASKADISSVKECLRKGASVNYKGSSGNTALHLAVLTKNTELTDLLIREGADLNLPNGLQKTPHDIADGNTKELLKQQTQRYYAVLRGDTDVVSLLIKKGANLNLQDTHDRTLLYIAVLYGYKEVIAALVKEGAELNLQNEEGLTPLHQAVISGYQDVTALLIRKGANINIQDRMGQTPLYKAVFRNNMYLSYQLMKEGADVNITDNDSNTPLYIAVQNGFKDAVPYLIRMGADVNIQNNENRSVYDTANEEIKELIAVQQRLLSKASEEIRSLGMETAVEFQDILQLGKYKCFWNRIYLVGPPSVGKSTLAKILVGDPIPTEREATDGIWIYMGRAGMDVEHSKWIHLTKGSAIKEVLTSMLISLHLGQEVPTSDEDETLSESKERTDKSQTKVKEPSKIHIPVVSMLSSIKPYSEKVCFKPNLPPKPKVHGFPRRSTSCGNVREANYPQTELSKPKAEDQIQSEHVQSLAHCLEVAQGKHVQDEKTNCMQVKTFAKHKEQGKTKTIASLLNTDSTKTNTYLPTAISDSRFIGNRPANAENITNSGSVRSLTNFWTNKLAMTSNIPQILQPVQETITQKCEEVDETNVGKPTKPSAYFTHVRQQMTLFMEQSPKPIPVFHNIADAENTCSGSKSYEQAENIETLSSNLSSDKIHKLFIQAIQEGKYKQKIIPIDIWDFGGHKDFYMTHQIFITSRGIYVLMFNGSIDIHKNMPDVSFLPGHFNRTTIAGYLLHWVNSILTYCKRTYGGFPRILFVATHKDKISKKDIESHRQKLKTSISELFKSHAGLKHLEIERMLFINGKDSNDIDIALVRQWLIKTATEHPRWGEEMPTAWVPLELQLAEQVERGINVISRHQLQMLNLQNKSMVLSDKQLNTFLRIQHSLGKLLFFDDLNLQNFIIINPAYMVEVLRSIITDMQFWPKGEEYFHIFEKLQTTGMINRDEIYILWKQEVFKHILPYKEFMVELLVYLDILIPPQKTLGESNISTVDNEFLVPSMITMSNETNYLKKFRNPSTTIVMAYTFVQEVLPPALVYRFLGSFLTMWGVKNYRGKKMLFNDLVVVEVDENHDVIVYVENNRIVVSLVHGQKKENIISTLAASIQECLTAAIHRTTEFYSMLTEDECPNLGKESSFTCVKQMAVKNDNKEQHLMSFNIEFGVFCSGLLTKTSLCYFPHQLMPTTRDPKWTCQQHKNSHNVDCLRVWFAQKKTVERCTDSCKDLGEIEMGQQVLDCHILRLAVGLTSSEFYNLVFNLALSFNEWDDLSTQFQHDNPVNMRCMALYKWKQKTRSATFSNLRNAMEKCGLNLHRLCQVFRELDIPADDIGLSKKDLMKKPTLKTLQKLSNHIGDKSMQLGIELGFDIPEIQSIQHQYCNKLLEQTKEILRRWRKCEHPRSSFETLVKALNRIDLMGCLREIDL